MLKDIMKIENTLLIAEIGQAHDGSLGILHSYIDALSNTGVDAVKFQMHISSAESSKYEPFRVKFSYEDKTRYDYWKRMEFTFGQWMDIKQHCDDVGLEFICSPFSNAAVEWLEEIGVQRYKIGSGEVNNFLLLEKVGRTGKEIILSSGMSNYSELDEAIEFLGCFNCKISLLQCTTKYPTKAKDVGLNVMKNFYNRYQIPVGLSDHSGMIYPALSAATLGASIIEFHVVYDKNMFGPDSSSSLTISEVKELVNGIRFVDESLKFNVDKENNKNFENVKKIFEKSLSVNKDLESGHVLTFSDLEAKKPYGIGIPAKEYKNLIGKKINKNMRRWDFLKKENIYE